MALDKSKNILLADDDEDFRIRTAMILRNAGYGVAATACGAEAMSMLLSGAILPEAILLDLVMPVMDGWRFREIQKEHAELWRIPVIVMADAPIDDEYGAILEAAGTLIKPFERGELLRALALVLPKKNEVTFTLPRRYSAAAH